MPRQRILLFNRFKGRNNSGNSQLTAGCVCGRRACERFALRGCCRRDATPVPFYVGPLLLHSSSKLCTARRYHEVFTSQVQWVAIFRNDFLILSAFLIIRPTETYQRLFLATTCL